jgi:hypothetical protein
LLRAKPLTGGVGATPPRKNKKTETNPLDIWGKALTINKLKIIKRQKLTISESWLKSEKVTITLYLGKSRI